MNMPQLASAVVAHAKRQHEDSKWDIVVCGMTYEEVKDILTKAGAKTPRAAIRAVGEHLDTLVALV